MIITRTPYRISFFGGGSDYPDWYLKNGGSVLSTSINKYCYLTVRYLPPFFEHRIRLVYSRIELCKGYEEIVHPSVRECLRFFSWNRGVEIHHDGDLPARSGMGSSSSFTVGLLHALHALQGKMPSKERLSREAIRVEQEMIGETVGSQDQVAAANGGFNHIIFNPVNGEIEVRPLPLPRKRMELLESHLMLFFTGIRRFASDVAKTYVDDISCKNEQIKTLMGMVQDGIDILLENKDICQFGELLHQAWLTKRGLSCNVSNDTIDGLYARAREAGAIGGKIAGAGGGGFLLLFVPPERQEAVRNTLHEAMHVPFCFDSRGSQIVFHDTGYEDYEALDLARTANGNGKAHGC